MLSSAADAKLRRDSQKAIEADQCLICLEPPTEPTSLPCGHTFCTGCVSELRAKGVADACPLCRAPLPPGMEKLFDLAYRAWWKLARKVSGMKEVQRPGCVIKVMGGELCPWKALSAPQQEEMNGVIVMLDEAMAQVTSGKSLAGDRCLLCCRCCVPVHLTLATSPGPRRSSFHW